MIEENECLEYEIPIELPCLLVSVRRSMYVCRYVPPHDLTTWGPGAWGSCYVGHFDTFHWSIS